MNNILVVGSVNIDYIFNVKNMPKPSETITAKSLKKQYGGKGCNQAFSAKLTGSNVDFLACVGTDGDGVEVKKYLSDLGFCNCSIKECDESTGKAIVMVSDDSENMIVITPGANNLLTPSVVEQNMDLIEKNDIILLQNEIPEQTNYYIINKAKEKGKYVALNLAPARHIPDEYLKQLDCLVVNEIELKFLGKSIEELLDLGVKSILLTLGKKGSKYITKKEKIECDAEKVNAVDTTGAGDAFMGAFFSMYNEGDIQKSLDFATKVASVVVQYTGAQVKKISLIK